MEKNIWVALLVQHDGWDPHQAFLGLRDDLQCQNSVFSSKNEQKSPKNTLFSFVDALNGLMVPPQQVGHHFEARGNTSELSCEARAKSSSSKFQFSYQKWAIGAKITKKNLVFMLFDSLARPPTAWWRQPSKLGIGILKHLEAPVGWVVGHMPNRQAQSSVFPSNKWPKITKKHLFFTIWRPQRLDS